MDNTCSCSGNLVQAAFNCDLGFIDLWDCFCDKCGEHKMGAYAPECNCGGKLEYMGEHKFIEAGEGFITGIFRCNGCLKEYLRAVSVEELNEFLL